MKGLTSTSLLVLAMIHPNNPHILPTIPRINASTIMVGAFPFPIISLIMCLTYMVNQIKSKFSTKRGRGMRPNLRGDMRKKEEHAF